MKLADLQFTGRNLLKGMPRHTPTTFDIPMKFSNRLPPNVSDFSDKVMNKYFDNHLHEIEEAHHQKLLPPNFLRWFLNQYRQYHYESGIGNHDGFLKSKPTIFYKPSMDFGDVAFLASLNAPVNGLDLETVVGDASGNYTVNNLSGNEINVGTGIAGTLYDQLAHSLVTAAGNINLGAYDDDGGGPNKPVNLEAETGSITSTADYAFKSVTEFPLDTAQQWIATIHDSTQSTNFKGTGIANSNYDVAQAFGALPDPFTAATLLATPLQLKMGHS